MIASNVCSECGHRHRGIAKCEFCDCFWEEITHTHENGVTHSHKDGDKPHTHEELNMKKIINWIWKIICWPVKKIKQWIWK